MKKHANRIVLLLAVIAALILAACAGPQPPAETAAPAPEPAATAAGAPEPSAGAETPAPEPAEPSAAPAEVPTEAPSEAPTETPAEPEGPFSPEGSVLFEKDGVKVTTAGLDLDPTSLDPQTIIWLEIENSGEEDAFLGVADGYINGFAGNVVFVEFFEEDGAYYGGSYTFDLVIPQGSSDRYALSYYRQEIPGVDMNTLEELEFCFTLAEDEYSWPDYSSEPVVIRTGETTAPVDITALGTVVVDDERLTLVFGEQDYDEWFGPCVSVYAENKSGNYLGISADRAEADGVGCDYIYYAAALAPGKRSADMMSFDGEIRELLGFEDLSVSFILSEAASGGELDAMNGETLGPVSIQYPPQAWGEYENGGMTLSIRPKINALVTVETPVNDPQGILFSVSETESLEAGGFEGAGALFSIGKVSEEKVHELLCYDMSGVNVFARDAEGSYYVYYHPTDVRYARATTEEMQSDAEQWTMLCRWAESVPDSLLWEYDLESVYYGNSDLDIYLARAAFMEGQNVTLSTTEFGPVPAAGVDGAPYAEFVLRGVFGPADTDEAPDGEYVVLAFPDEDVRLDFFFAPGAYARLVSGERETVYQAAWFDDNVSYAEAMKGWYYAAAEQAGVRPADDSLLPYCGEWHEEIAGRGTISISRSLAPGKVNIAARWPESAAVADTWEIVASLEEGRLVYDRGIREVTEYDEEGSEWTLDWSDEESGFFYLNETGALCWHDDSAERSEDSVFLR